jgi:hypothetical protein
MVDAAPLLFPEDAVEIGFFDQADSFEAMDTDGTTIAVQNIPEIRG